MILEWIAPGSTPVSLLQGGLRRVCAAGIAAAKADPGPQTTLEQAEAALDATVAELGLPVDSAKPGWALLAGGGHGIDGMLIVPFDSPQPSMLYLFVQSKMAGDNATLGLPDIFTALRASMAQNDIQLPVLDKHIPGDVPQSDPAPLLCDVCQLNS